MTLQLVVEDKRSATGTKPEVIAPAEEPQQVPMIGVLVPASKSEPYFTYDLAQMMAFSALQIVASGSAKIVLLFGACTYIHVNRNDLVETAKEQGCTHLLWLDDDMRFPKDTLIRLLKHKTDIVGANYSKRTIPPSPTAVKRVYDPPERLYTRRESTGLEEVEGIGFGAVLIGMWVFDSIEYPWFENYRNRERSEWIGEDVDFCMKARTAGWKIFVDHDLSQQVGHLGTYLYENADAQAFKDAQDAERAADGLLE